MTVTRVNYPAVFRAFSIIAEDNGFVLSTRVPSQYEPLLPMVEAGLRPLVDYEMFVFCCGEAEEIENMIAANPELAPAYALLQVFINGWEER